MEYKFLTSSVGHPYAIEMQSLLSTLTLFGLAIFNLVYAVPWQARHRLTSSDYQNTFDQLISKQYRLTYVSGYTINNDPRFAAIWVQKSNSQWVARHGLTGTEYQQQFDALIANGYTLILVDGYTVNGEPRYAAIWDNAPHSAWIARHGMTSDEYQTEFNTHVSQGYRLKHVSGYAQGSTALYAAIWEMDGTNVQWVAHHGMTSTDYQNKFDQYTSTGFRPLLVGGYGINGVDYYVAIWDKSASGGWVARHGMTSDGYQQEFNHWVGQGYTLTAVSGYTLSSDQDRYAALWYK
jgi:hypothetical protein